jgi:Rod binding domain-containing protein
MIAATRQTASSSHASAAALRVQTAVGRKLDVHDPAVARRTAAQFLSELFFKPILAEMRRFPIGRELATGGQTESIFGEQLDQRIADGVAAAQPGLVNAMLRNFGDRTAVPPAGHNQSSWNMPVGSASSQENEEAGS